MLHGMGGKLLLGRVAAVADGEDVGEALHLQVLVDSDPPRLVKAPQRLEEAQVAPRRRLARAPEHKVRTHLLPALRPHRDARPGVVPAPAQLRGHLHPLVEQHLHAQPLELVRELRVELARQPRPDELLPAVDEGDLLLRVVELDLACQLEPHGTPADDGDGGALGHVVAALLEFAEGLESVGGGWLAGEGPVGARRDDQEVEREGATLAGRSC
mmetsp:Transcript_58516/g.154347  ORF Transcript_58516/g.154347 Transcript_58516/m.154347 type:complete len:214 (+) Transcript_58516:522-1163(+)